MTTWEYRIVSMGFSERGSLVDKLNAAGQEGWEAVSFASSANGSTALMKRRLS